MQGVASYTQSLQDLRFWMSKQEKKRELYAVAVVVILQIH